MVITELCEFKGDTWCIETDEGRKFYVNVLIVEGFELKKGQTLTETELAAIKEADVLRKAKKRALYLLGEREMCLGELTSKLAKTYGETVANEAAEYARSLGYVDDEKYAPRLAEYLIKRKQWGIRRVRYEMLRRGLERSLVDNTLADFQEDELDEELMALIEKKYARKVHDLNDRRKTTAALARRGYDLGAIKRCIGNFLENEDNDDDEIYEDQEDEFQ